MSTANTALESSEACLSVSWLDDCRNNRESLLEIPWERGAEITDSERTAIWDSVREFQLGENLEGTHIIRCADEFAVRQRSPACAEAIELFIREEQRHARGLGRFMASPASHNAPAPGPIPFLITASACTKAALLFKTIHESLDQISTFSP